MEEISFTSTRELSAEYVLNNFNEKITKTVMKNTGACEIESGIDVIDRLSGGIPQKGFTLVMGQDFLLQENLCVFILSEILRQNKYRCCMITLSQGYGEITKSLVSSFSHVSLGKLNAGKLSRDDQNSINKAESVICEAGFKIFESSVMQVTELEKILQKVKEEGYEIVFINQINNIHDKKLKDGDETVHVIEKLYAMSHSLKLAVIGFRNSHSCLNVPADFYDRIIIHLNTEPEKDFHEDKVVQFRVINPFTGSDETGQYCWNQNHLNFVHL